MNTDDKNQQVGTDDWAGNESAHEVERVWWGNDSCIRHFGEAAESCGNQENRIRDNYQALRSKRDFMRTVEFPIPPQHSWKWKEVEFSGDVGRDLEEKTEKETAEGEEREREEKGKRRGRAG